MAVVDEHGELTGGGVQVGGDAADVPAVAGREQGQETDGRVFGGVGGSEEIDAAADEPRALCGRDGPPDGAGAQRSGRQVERGLAGCLAGVVSAAGIGDDLVGHADVAEPDVGLAACEVPQLADDIDLGDLPGGGGVAGFGGVDERDSVGEVQLVDEEGLALVQVDGAGVSLRVRGGLVYGADEPSGGGLDDADRVGSGAAQAGQPVGAIATGPVPAGGTLAEQSGVG